MVSKRRPTAWTELTRGQLGKAKDIKILKAMGTTAFLFRDAASRNKHLPLREHALEPLWYKLLQCLEQKVNQNATTEAEQNLKFVHDDLNITTYYPLHSLRVSLITAFALEGGVPMPVVGMIIAENKKLKNENNMLKNQTCITIDMRNQKNATSPTSDVVVVSALDNLTETEIDALKDAVSDNFFKDRGWTTDEQGRVKEKGYPVYKTGYVTAIKKILEEL